MNRAIICLGSNIGSAKAEIASALELLKELGTVEDSSGNYLSDPEYSSTEHAYTNCIVILDTEMSSLELGSRCKSYESRRRQTVRFPGRVTIDIDIVRFNDTVLRLRDYAASYFCKGVQLLSRKVF